jgi:hypothetical protein
LVFRVETSDPAVDTYWSSSRGHGDVRAGLATRGSLLEQLAEFDLRRSFGADLIRSARRGAAAARPSRHGRAVPAARIFQEIQDAFTQAGDEDSVFPIHFYQRWGAAIAIERRPSVAARLHAAEQALADPDPGVRDSTVGSLQASRRGLRTVQLGPLMLVYLTDVRGEHLVIQVNWIG